MIFSYSRHAVQGRACSLWLPRDLGVLTYVVRKRAAHRIDCLRTSGPGHTRTAAHWGRSRVYATGGGNANRGSRAFPGRADQAAAAEPGASLGRWPGWAGRQGARPGPVEGWAGRAGSQAWAGGGLGGPGARPGPVEGWAGRAGSQAGSGWSEARPGGQERSVILRPAVDLAAIVARPAVALPWVPAGDPAGEHHRAPRSGDPQEPRVAKAADCPDHHRDEADAEP